MPQIIFSTPALKDLERLREFLRTKSPIATRHAGATIVNAIKILGSYPLIGRPSDDMNANYRELLIDFGDSGYIALYRHDVEVVTVLAIRHQKELGFNL